MNKKLLIYGGIGLLSIVMVTALIYVATTTEFTKTIHMWWTGAGDSKVSMIITGDVSTTTISCENGICESGEITLTNPDTIEHSCSVITTGDERVTVTYEGNVIDNQITINKGSSEIIKVKYASANPGDYPMKTTISC